MTDYYWKDDDGVTRIYPLSELIRKYAKVNSSIVQNRLAIGWSIRRALTTPVRQKTKIAVTIEGKTFNSLTELCDFYKISYHTCYMRLKKHKDIKKVINPPLQYRLIKPVDHMGQEFRSISEMCRHYGLISTTFYSRLRKKWDLERVLTEPVRKKTR